MTICPSCGVWLEPGFTECPLCQSSFTEKKETIPDQRPAYPGIGKALSKKEKARLFWELAGILHLSSIIVLLFIDLMLNKKPGWSWYPIAGITASYAYITLFVFTIRKPFVLLAGILVNTSWLLLFIDILYLGMDWFLVPALPLVIFAVLLIGIVMAFSRNTRHKGMNIIAAAALAIGAYNVVIDLCISWMKKHTLDPGWSLVVSASLLPFALILFYFHYRLKRGTSLRKFFHL
jgi:hypothetical protein